MAADRPAEGASQVTAALTPSVAESARASGAPSQILVVVCGLVLTLAVVFLAGRLEERSARSQLAALAEQRFALVDANLARALDGLAVVGAFFDAGREVSREQFSQLTRPLLSRQPALQALEWVPYTTLAALPALRARMQIAGQTDFEIHEISPTGRQEPVGPRAEYFPVVHVEPRKGNEAALGFDLGSNPQRYEALDAARRSGRMVATGRVRLVQGGDGAYGVLVFRPVYLAPQTGTGSATAASENRLADPAALRGYVIGVFRLDRLIGADLSGPAAGRVELLVIDEQAAGAERLLFPSDAALPDQNANAAAGATRLQHHLGVAGRGWTLIAQAPGGILQVDRTATRILLAAGLLLTVLMALMQEQNRHRHQQVEKVVAARTANLQESERRLIQANHQAVQASRMKTMFLANMSHEFRTPMNAILGLLHVLGRTPLDGVQRDHIDKIGSAARRLLRLIDDILDVSRIEAGKLSVDHQAFKLETVLRDVLVAVAPKLRDKPVELVLDLDPSLPAHLVGDGMRLTQVLVNLSDNAAKFTAEGEIVLSMGFVSLPDGRIELRVEVRDSGPGLSEQETQALFQPFVQSETTRHGDHGGTGLGLAICRQLINLMGGEIGVESRPGHGSRFHFVLPLALQSASPLASPREGYAPAVLLIDRNAASRAALARLIVAFGCPVEVCASSEAARSWLGAHRCDLLIGSRDLDLDALVETLPPDSPRPRVASLAATGDSLHGRSLLPILERPLLPAVLAEVLASCPAPDSAALVAPRGVPVAPVQGARAAPHHAVPVELVELATKLRVLLKTGDPDAEEAARALAQAARGTPHAAAASELLRLCSDFDFRDALTALDALCPATLPLEN